MDRFACRPPYGQCGSAAALALLGTIAWALWTLPRSAAQDSESGPEVGAQLAETGDDAPLPADAPPSQSTEAAVDERTVDDTSEVHIAPAPEWIDPMPVRLHSPFAETDAEGGTAYLSYDRQVRAIDGIPERYTHHVRKFVTEAGVQSRSQLEVTFDPDYETVRFHTLRIHRDGEVLERLGPSVFRVVVTESGRERQLFDGSRSAVAVIEDVRVGDVLEYAYTVSGANPVFGGRFYDSFATEWSIPVGSLRYRLLWDPERHLSIVPHPAAGEALEPTEHADEHAPGVRILTWSRENVQAVHADDQVPGGFDTHGWVELTEYESWNAVARWAAEQYRWDEILPDAILKQAATIRETEPTPEARTAAALRLVQDQFRYVGFFNGVHSHRPHDLATIVARRFGDCKDKAKLLVAFLRELGLDARPALVDVDAGNGIGRLAPSPFAFDHAVVHVRLDGRDYWLDPTRSYQRGTLDRIHFPEYGHALLVSPDAEALIPIVPQARDASHVEVSETYEVPDYSGEATLRVQTVYSGRHADAVRHYFSSNSRQSIEKNYRQYYAQNFGTVDLASEIATEDDEAANRLTVTERYRLDRIWNESSTDAGFLECSFHARTISDYLSMPSDRLRSMPFALTHPTRVDHRIEVVLPEPLGLGAEAADVVGGPLEYRFKADPEGRRMVLDHRFRTRREIVAPDEIDRYVTDGERIEDRLAYWILVPEAFADVGDRSPDLTLFSNGGSTKGDAFFEFVALVATLACLAGMVGAAGFAVPVFSRSAIGAPAANRPFFVPLLGCLVVAAAMALPTALVWSLMDDAARSLFLHDTPADPSDSVVESETESDGAASGDVEEGRSDWRSRMGDTWLPAYAVFRAAVFAFLTPLAFLVLGAFFIRSPGYPAMQAGFLVLLGLLAALSAAASVVWKELPGHGAVALGINGGIVLVAVAALGVLTASRRLRRWYSVSA